MTQTESVLGTPLYVSPEAIAEPGKVGPRSDLYAVGALGYHLLTGHSVFPGRTVAEVYARHLYSEPEAPSVQVAGVPADLEALILSCLKKDPEERPVSARTLRVGCSPAPRAHAHRAPRRRGHGGLVSASAVRGGVGSHQPQSCEA